MYLEVGRLCVCVSAHGLAKIEPLISFHSFDCFLSHTFYHFGMRLLKNERLSCSVSGYNHKIQKRVSELGGRVTINLVKSADESLSHRYNQRHFRPLFPQRNSCFLWHVLKFYFKNSQRLKAHCCILPRPSLTMCFQFSQSYYHVSGSDVSCCPHRIRTRKDLA